MINLIKKCIIIAIYHFKTIENKYLLRFCLMRYVIVNLFEKFAAYSSIMFGLLDPAIGKVNSSLQSCSEQGCVVTETPTTSSQLPVETTAKCEGGYSFL